MELSICFSLLVLSVICASINAAIIPRIGDDQFGMRPAYKVIGILSASPSMPDMDENDYRAIIEGLFLNNDEDASSGHLMMRRRTVVPTQTLKRYSFLDASQLLASH